MQSIDRIPSISITSSSYFICISIIIHPQHYIVHGFIGYMHHLCSKTYHLACTLFSKPVYQSIWYTMLKHNESCKLAQSAHLRFGRYIGPYKLTLLNHFGFEHKPSYLQVGFLVCRGGGLVTVVLWSATIQLSVVGICTQPEKISSDPFQ